MGGLSGVAGLLGIGPLTRQLLAQRLSGSCLQSAIR
jgi:hypothetical protein